MISREEYDRYCAQCLDACLVAAVAKRSWRGLDEQAAEAKAAVLAKHAKTLAAIDVEVGAATDALATQAAEGRAKADPFLERAEKFLDLLWTQLQQARAAGEEWPDPPLPKGTSVRFDRDVTVLDDSLVPASFKVVDTKKVELSQEEVPGTLVRSKARLTVRMK